MRRYPPTMRDLLRRLRGWLFPPADPSTRAALDGGPGPEPRASDAEIRAVLLDRLADGLDVPREWLIGSPTYDPPTPEELADIRRSYEKVANEVTRQMTHLLPPGVELSWEAEAGQPFAGLGHDRRGPGRSG